MSAGLRCREAAARCSSIRNCEKLFDKPSVEPVKEEEPVEKPVERAKPEKPLTLPKPEKPAIKPIPVAPMRHQLDKKNIVQRSAGKPDRPLDVNQDRSKVVEYILNNSKNIKMMQETVAVKEPEQASEKEPDSAQKEPQAPVKPLHPKKVKKNIHPVAAHKAKKK